MKITKASSDHLEIEKLPDGSAVIFDTLTKTVYSLNETAAAAWLACDGKPALAEVAVAMSKSLLRVVPEEVALEGLLQLQEKGLVQIETPSTGFSRRSFATAAGIMAPVVLALTSSEQRAFAQAVGSGTTTTTTTTTTTSTTSTTTTTTTTSTTRAPTD
jgi:hypothetical protein